MKNISHILTLFLLAMQVDCLKLLGASRYISSLLSSSKFNINLVTPTGLPADLPKVEADLAAAKLLGAPKEMSIESVKSKLAKSKQKGVPTNVQMEAILNVAMDENSHVLLTDNMSASTEPDTYITESELRKLWLVKSEKPMGKPVDKFEVMDSLLLLGDEDDAFMEEGDAEADEETADTADTEGGVPEPEIFITQTVRALSLYLYRIHCLPVYDMYSRSWKEFGQSGQPSCGACLVRSFQPWTPSSCWTMS